MKCSRRALNLRSPFLQASLEAVGSVGPGVGSCSAFDHGGRMWGILVLSENILMEKQNLPSEATRF